MKAIETYYNGYRFRSRLEARWAVFFDTLGIEYLYEPEGYDLDEVWYLPDFWLPKQDCWVEIKAERPIEEECRKAELLLQATQKEVFILWGNFQPTWMEVTPLRTIEEASQIFEETGEYLPIMDVVQRGTLGHKFLYHSGNVYCSDTEWMFTECPVCQKIELAFLGLANNMSCHCIENEIAGVENLIYGFKSPRLLEDYMAARSARFEYGERGRP